MVHLGMQSTFGTLGEVYLAPWAAGERVSLTRRMPTMLEEAGEPDSPSFEKRAGGSKPFFTLSFLVRPGRTNRRPEHQPSQAAHSRSQSGSWLPLWLAFLRLATKAGTIKQKYCSEQVTAWSTGV